MAFANLMLAELKVILLAPHMRTPPRPQSFLSEPDLARLKFITGGERSAAPAMPALTHDNFEQVLRSIEFSKWSDEFWTGTESAGLRALGFGPQGADDDAAD